MKNVTYFCNIIRDAKTDKAVKRSHVKLLKEIDQLEKEQLKALFVRAVYAIDVLQS